MIKFGVLCRLSNRLRSGCLKQSSGFIRKKLCERIDIRHMPELEFVFDESIEYGKNIEKIIEDLNK